VKSLQLLTRQTWLRSVAINKVDRSFASVILGCPCTCMAGMHLADALVIIISAGVFYIILITLYRRKAGLCFRRDLCLHDLWLHAMFCRASIYLEGGVLFITTRILVVDMLVERIPVHLVSGILVYKAHKYVHLVLVHYSYSFSILILF